MPNMLTIIQINNLSKLYRLGTINRNTFKNDIINWWRKNNINERGNHQNKSVNNECSAATGLFFKPDGSKVYVTGCTEINEYSLTKSNEIEINNTTRIHGTLISDGDVISYGDIQTSKLGKLNNNNKNNNNGFNQNAFGKQESGRAL